MYVIVEIQGQQFKAEEGKFLYVHYLGEKAQAGDTVEFDRVLLADKDGEVLVGAPTVEGAKVVCEVAESLVKGDKVIVFKKKRRKGYRRSSEHHLRDPLSVRQPDLQRGYPAPQLEQPGSGDDDHYLRRG